MGLVLAFWGLGIVLGRPLVSQTDYAEDGSTFGKDDVHLHICILTAAKARSDMVIFLA